MAEQNSLVNYGNPFDTETVAMSSSGMNILNSQDQSLFGFFGPSVIQGQSNDLHMCHNSNSYTLETTLTERNTREDSLYAVPNPVNQGHVYSHYMEGMPLTAASLPTILSSRGNPHQHLQNFATSNSFASIDASDHSNLSSQTSLRCGQDSVSTHLGYRGETGAKAMGRTGMQSFGSMVNIAPHGWITSQDTHFGSDCAGLSMLNNELSLSLATANPTLCATSIQDQYSDICCSSTQYDGCSGSEPTPCSKNESWRFSSSKSGQLSQVFSCSAYVRAIQEILGEVALYSLGNAEQINHRANGTEDQTYPFSLVDSDEFPDENTSTTVQRVPSIHGSAYERKKKCLLALLPVVDKQYNQCLDDIHTVVSAFHAVTELNTHVHARFALQTLSFLYRNLRERISNQILAMGPNFYKETSRLDDKSFEASFLQKQWALQQLRLKDNQLFRPQRGLPERSVSVLRAWMFQNFLHPYPKDAEKHLLAVKSGLSRSQVSNWFINARVRLWKPMIEEMYAEMNRRSRQDNEETNDNQRSHVTVENQRYSLYRHH